MAATALLVVLAVVAILAVAAAAAGAPSREGFWTRYVVAEEQSRPYYAAETGSDPVPWGHTHAPPCA